MMLVGGVIGAAVIASQGRRQQAEERRMLAEGRETEGVVTRLWRGDGDSDDYGVEYRFTVDGRDYPAHAIVGSGHWKRLHALPPITVRYLPSAPAHNYPSADPPQPHTVLGALSPERDLYRVGRLAALSRCAASAIFWRTAGPRPPW